MKKIYRSRDDRILTGLIGGIAEHFNINSQILRIAFVILCIVFGHIIGGILLYAICLLFIQSAPINHDFYNSDTTSTRKNLKNVDEFKHK